MSDPIGTLADNKATCEGERHLQAIAAWNAGIRRARETYWWEHPAGRVCRNGHPDEAPYIRPNGKRECRTCRAKGQAERGAA